MFNMGPISASPYSPHISEICLPRRSLYVSGLIQIYLAHNRVFHRFVHMFDPYLLWGSGPLQLGVVLVIIIIIIASMYLWFVNFISIWFCSIIVYLYVNLLFFPSNVHLLYFERKKLKLNWCQVSRSCDFKPRRLSGNKQTNKQTDRQTNKQTHRQCHLYR